MVNTKAAIVLLFLCGLDNTVEMIIWFGWVKYKGWHLYNLFCALNKTIEIIKLVRVVCCD